jgi:hypothetical protein
VAAVIGSAGLGAGSSSVISLTAGDMAEAWGGQDEGSGKVDREPTATLDGEEVEDGLRASLGQLVKGQTGWWRVSGTQARRDSWLRVHVAGTPNV